jgi:hypothetical protein
MNYVFIFVNFFYVAIFYVSIKIDNVFKKMLIIEYMIYCESINYFILNWLAAVANHKIHYINLRGAITSHLFLYVSDKKKNISLFYSLLIRF